MEEYEKATVEVVEMETTAVIAASGMQSAPKKNNGIPEDPDAGFDVIP